MQQPESGGNDHGNCHLASREPVLHDHKCDTGRPSLVRFISIDPASITCLPGDSCSDPYCSRGANLHVSDVGLGLV